MYISTSKQYRIPDYLVLHCFSLAPLLACYLSIRPCQQEVLIHSPLMSFSYHLCAFGKVSVKVFCPLGNWMGVAALFLCLRSLYILEIIPTPPWFGSSFCYRAVSCSLDCSFIIGSFDSMQSIICFPLCCFSFMIYPVL